MKHHITMKRKVRLLAKILYHYSKNGCILDHFHQMEQLLAYYGSHIWELAAKEYNQMLTENSRQYYAGQPTQSCYADLPNYSNHKSNNQQ